MSSRLSRAIYYRYFSRAFSVPGLEIYTRSALGKPSPFASIKYGYETSIPLRIRQERFVTDLEEEEDEQNARVSAARESIAISPDFKYGDKIPDVYVRDEDGVVRVYTVGQHIEFSLMARK